MSSQPRQQPPQPRRPDHEQAPRAGHGLRGTAQRIFLGSYPHLHGGDACPLAFSVYLALIHRPEVVSWRAGH